MTTIFPIKQKCAICGKRSEHPMLGSTNEFGSRDLDTRPPELARSTISMWIQNCPSCGYCAPDISKAKSKASELVESNIYRKNLKNPDLPDLANYFLCWSLIQENAEDYANAGWASIHAAWACDDFGNDKNAKSCRMRAVAMLQKAKEKGQKFAENTGAEYALMVDLLRRSGQLDLALSTCEEGLKKKPKKIIANIL